MDYSSTGAANPATLVKESLVLHSIEEELVGRWFAARVSAGGGPEDSSAMLRFTIPWLAEAAGQSAGINRRSVFAPPEGEEIPDVGVDLTAVDEDKRGEVARMIAALRNLNG